jgi:hypothetical protein
VLREEGKGLKGENTSPFAWLKQRKLQKTCVSATIAPAVIQTLYILRTTPGIFHLYQHDPNIKIVLWAWVLIIWVTL